MNVQGKKYYNQDGGERIVYSVFNDEFKEYGQILKGYDFTDLFHTLMNAYIPDTGITYCASVEDLENCSARSDMQNRGFGGMPIQIGYVGGNNKALNCLEFHKSSEFNIALNDVILLLGKQTDIKNGSFDTSLCKAFLIPEKIGVELYATTLHYAPINAECGGYRVACVLPKGTNGEKPKFKVVTEEDKMCAGSNKWLISHKDSTEAFDGGYVGLAGENIKMK